MAQRKKSMRTPKSVALIGSYVPRQCGIATFTKDLHDALRDHLPANGAYVVAMDDLPSGYAYPPEVCFQIREQRQSDYRMASDFLNINQVEMLCVQHEYGIFGGRDGVLLLDLLRPLRMPLVTTLHTVLEKPTEGQAHVLREIAALSDRLVVMSRHSEDLLREVHDVPAEKIVLIPHGIPDVPFVDPNFYKDQYGVEGRTVLLSFGLLSPGKGFEVAIDALPEVVARHPEVIYVILGATHPNVLLHDGDAYRFSLQNQVQRLGLQDHVKFLNRYVTLDELVGYIGSADIYITPYLNEAQVVSGTLAYSLGAGKAVISSPYWFAKEILAEGRGRLFPFRDSRALAEEINYLLENPTERHAIRKRAYMHCRNMVWKEVATAYMQTFVEVLEERTQAPRPRTVLQPQFTLDTSIPEVDLRHLKTLTDDTGIFQHANYTVPDRNFGYCTDDNARALVAAVQYYDLRREKEILPLALTYLSFLQHAFNSETGRFRNFLSYDRRWLEQQGSYDVHGRALWALGLTSSIAPSNGLSSLATRLFNEGLEKAEELDGPRSWAFALVGLHAYLKKFGGDAQARRIRKVLAERLYSLFEQVADEEWPWCENIVTYCNGKIPHALILAGQWLPHDEMLRQGIRSLEWLLEIQTSEDGCLSLIGNQGWMQRGGEKARFDQQPVELMALVEACAEAYLCTRDDKWLAEMRRCIAWFQGVNDCRTYVCDFRTGGCRDGLQPDGANLNEGAESTLAWLISLITAHRLQKEKGNVDA